MEWSVQFTKKAAKQVKVLTKKVVIVLQVLIHDLQKNGPSLGPGWANYGKLHGKKKEDIRHCHLIKGSPTYVCCWRVFKSEKIIEVFYVGTHEKAPY